MSKLDELINELCPDGVEYKTLNTICTISKGIQFNKRNMNSVGTFPVINGGTNPSGYIEQYNQDGNAITISQGGASAGYVNWIPVKFWAGAHCYVILPLCIINNRFLYHYIKMQEPKLQECQYGAGIPALSKTTLENFSIPLPPLPVQEEIVRILDNFTELTAELTARKNHYYYYIDRLLTFNDEVECKTLGEIATDMYRGSGIKRDEITEDGTPCVRYGEIYTQYNVWFDTCCSKTHAGTKSFSHGDVLFAITGESVEEIAKSCVYMGNDTCFAGGDIVVMKHNQNPKYISYALSTTNAQMQKSKGKVKSKVVHSSIPALKAITIPVPSLPEQQRIVDILDRFYTLCNDISIGLPAEIKARQQQYEYYRDKLLTFPKVETEVSYGEEAEANRAEAENSKYKKAQF